MKQQLSIYLILLIIISSCQAPKEYDTPTYFGGQIINAKAKEVVLYKNDIAIDTLLLNEDNRFLKSIPVFEEGLYTFKHANEFQYLFIQPSDSIIVRLNTLDFDESLVFSGKGGLRNEFLIDVFIQNEVEDKSLRELYYLSSMDLKNEIEHIRQIKQHQLDEFLEQNGEYNNLYIKYARAAIDYPLYRKMEIYPLMKRKYLKSSKFPTVPDDFYDFRSKIDLNDPVLSNFYTHRNYVMAYAYHLAYQESEGQLNPNINVNLLNIVSDSIDNPMLRNSMIRSAMFDELFAYKSLNINQDLINTFIKVSDDEELKNQIDLLISDSEQVPNGSKVPNFSIISQNRKPYKINSLIRGRNSVIYFWSETDTETILISQRVQYLQRMYPSIQFIGINLDYQGDTGWNMRSLKGIPQHWQYSLTMNSKARAFTQSQFPRSILVNRNGYVIDNYGNISSRNFENSLKILEKN
ncbi:MAG: TlpA family protein disulfide reductase [Flavobacteriaceae bacterium]